MTPLSLALKALGGLSVAAAGATGAYFLLRPTSFGIDKFALETLDGTWSWTPVDNNQTINAGADNNVEITGTLTKTENSKAKIWTCKVKGIIKSPAANSTLGIQAQLTELKNAIGIKTDNTRDKSKQGTFQKFVNSCIKHRTSTPTETNSESTIDLGELELNSNTYKFKDSEFKKIYESTN